MSKKISNFTKIILKLFTIIPITFSFSCVMGQKNFQSDFEQNHKKWDEKKISNYQMTFELEVLEHNSVKESFTVVVRKGEIESFKQAEGKETPFLQAAYEGYTEIENFFWIAEEANAKDSKWKVNKLEYNSEFGYPSLIDVDVSDKPNDKMYIRVTHFEVINDSSQK